VTDAPSQTGPIDAAVANGVRMLAQRPDLAEQQAREVLAAVADHPPARLLLAQALRGQWRLAEAREVLDLLASSQPRWWTAHLELGGLLMEAGDAAAAAAALEHVVSLKPDLSEAWGQLAVARRRLGDARGADLAVKRQIDLATRDRVLVEAGAAMNQGRLAVAEHTLRDVLRDRPHEIAALRMLAELATRFGRYEDAEALLRRCLDIAPRFMPARHNLAIVLYRQARAAETLEEVEGLLQGNSRNPTFRNLQAAALTQLGEYGRAVEIYESLLKEHPTQPRGWMSYGHTLKTVGRQPDAVAAYRRAIELQPGLGEVWWSLANLKTVRFTPEDLDAMRGQLARTDLSDEDRFHLQFALGKALEDRGEAGSAFEQYAAGNALRKQTLAYDADETSRHLQRSRALFTAGFFAERDGYGSPAPDPIFIVGLPRAGSTLIEQILASHSAIEGTMELPDLPAIAKRLGGRVRRDEEVAYPDILRDLGPDACRALGEEYLRRAAPQRKLDRPFFIDKMPNNVSHVGLIQLILPNARIIDARRHPMGCCFSGFKQHFARGQGFTYDLTDLGRYYADYVSLMAHFDAVLPGRVHRVIYEQLVADPETQVRALLDYCGLPFEEGCLRFYENDRAVRTASSEQVRRPINTEGLDQWRPFEPWLGPLKAALGPVLDAYPSVPAQLG